MHRKEVLKNIKKSLTDFLIHSSLFIGEYMLEEKHSKALEMNYIILDNKNILFQDGVLLNKKEVAPKDGVKKTFTEIIKAHSDYKGDLYDYAYARNSGFLRRKRGTAKPKEQVTPVVKNVAQKEKKEIKVNSIDVIRAITLFVGIGAMCLSIYYNFEYFKEYLPLAFAVLFSVVIVTFATSAFEVSILFRKKGQKFLANSFLTLWFVVLFMSMTAIMATNFNRYESSVIQQMEDNKEVNADRLALETIKDKKENNLTLRAELDKKIIIYEEKKWGTMALLNQKSKLISDYDKLLDEEQKIKQRSPEAVLTQETKKLTFFDYAGRLLKADARVLQFIVSIFPALFMDIIAPFSVAVTIFLSKEKKNEED